MKLPRAVPVAAVATIAIGAAWLAATPSRGDDLGNAVAHAGAWCGLAAAAAQETLATPLPAEMRPPRYPARAQQVGGVLQDPPDVAPRDGITRLTLAAVSTTTSQHLFAYNGRTIAPTIHVVPGGHLLLDYADNLPTTSRQRCTLGICKNLTNMHLHGYGGTPDAPADDILTMLAEPGGSVLHYDAPYPAQEPPGLYWYHPHPHGESETQVLDGMSGPLIVDGIERYVPEVRGLRQHVLVVRAIPTEMQDAVNRAYLRDTETEMHGCGLERSGEPPDRAFTVNDSVRPTITGAPGERQFWRIVNASADHFADIRYSGGPLEVVALDGHPLVWRDPAHRTKMFDHVELPPATRVEAIVTLPRAGQHAVLRSQCVITGPSGDPNPAAVLADVTTSGAAWVAPTPSSEPVATPPPIPAAFAQIAAIENAPPAFTTIFTEDKHGFYINGELFAMDAPPMAHVKVGTIVHWRVRNDTDEVHPFHIHQVHFLTYAVNDKPVASPVWLDTVNVPERGSIDVVLDATDPSIRGVSVFHCHLLNHEDKGMMAKVVFE